MKHSSTYSKATPFHITSSGHATFISNGADSPTGNGLIYYNQQNPVYWDSLNNVVMPVCFEKPLQMKGYDNSLKGEEEAAFAKLYPNPSDGSKVELVYRFPNEETVRVKIYDLTGKLVYSKNNIKGEIQSIDLDLKGLNNGIYITKITGRTTQKTLQLVIH